MIPLFLWIIGTGCGDGNRPNISGIEVEAKLKRFDEDFFSMDTANIVSSLRTLQTAYRGFYEDYITEILGLSVDSLYADSSSHVIALKRFLHDYMPVRQEVARQYKSFSSEEKEIETALRHVKYYFPQYTLPPSIITFIGPFDANFLTSFGIQGDILTNEGLGIGLQLHLGEESGFYESPAFQTLYPEFIVQNFDAEHIVVNSMRNIVDDLYPHQVAGKPLIEQMVGQGRKLYLLTRFMPSKKEEVILGYNKKEFKAVKKNEGVIWSFFLSNDLLNNTDQGLIKNYIGESPKTPEFGDDAPGNLGSFAGLQIVKKFMEKYPETTLQQLMQMEVRRIYSLSKYKPSI